MRRHVYGSNLDTPDMLELATRTDWQGGLEAFYTVAAKGRPGHSREPNTYEALLQAGFFRGVGLPFVLEEAMSKAWYNPDGTPVVTAWNGEHFRDLMRASIANIHAAGGTVKAIPFDEPLTATIKGKFDVDKKLTGYSLETLAQIETAAIRELHGLGVKAYHIEPYPHLTTKQILDYFDVLWKTGDLPAQFIWDIDGRDGWGKPDFWTRLFRRGHGIESAAVRSDLWRATAAMHAMGMEVGVIIGGYSHHTQAEYAASVHTFSRQVRQVWPGDEIDAIYVVTWLEQPGVPDGGGPRYMPNNFPLDDPTSHLGILQTVRETWT